jgi:hypothetical protein
MSSSPQSHQNAQASTYMAENERFELAVSFCASLKAERRILFCPLDGKIDPAAARLASKICRMSSSP